MLVTFLLIHLCHSQCKKRWSQWVLFEMSFQVFIEQMPSPFEQWVFDFTCHQAPKDNVQLHKDFCQIGICILGGLEAVRVVLFLAAKLTLKSAHTQDWHFVMTSFSDQFVKGERALRVQSWKATWTSCGRSPSGSLTIRSRDESWHAFERVEAVAESSWILPLLCSGLQVWQPLAPDMVIVTNTGDEGRRVEKLDPEDWVKQWSSSWPWTSSKALQLSLFSHYTLYSKHY